jgi:hypothetical protein
MQSNYSFGFLVEDSKFSKGYINKNGQYFNPTRSGETVGHSIHNLIIHRHTHCIICIYT